MSATSYRSKRVDLAHHHPLIRATHEGWTWTCACGSASGRIPTQQLSWRQAVIAALLHSTSIAA